MNLLKDLHILVHSLGKKDKQRFTQLATMQGDEVEKRYYHLYKLLDARQAFNENEITDSYLIDFSPKQFADDKQYLSDKLLTVIQLATAGADKERECISSISNAYYLLKCGAHGMAKKEIDNAINIAVENNLYTYHYKALELKQTLLTVQSAGMQQLLKVNLEIATVGEKMSRLNTVANYTIKVRQLTNKFLRTNTARYKAESKKLLDSWLSLKLPSLNDKVVQIVEGNLLMGLYAASGKKKEAIEVIKEIARPVKKDFEKEHLAPYLLLTWSINAVTLCLSIDELNDARIFLADLVKRNGLPVVTKNEALKKEWADTVLRLKVEVMFYAGQYKEIIQLQDEIKAVGSKHSMFSNNPLALITKLGWAYLHQGHTERAYAFVMQNLSVSEAKENYGYNMMYYCIKAIAEIKQADFIAADNTIRNMSRFITRHPSADEHDVVIKKAIYSFMVAKNNHKPYTTVQRNIEKLNKLPASHFGTKVVAVILDAIKK